MTYSVQQDHTVPLLYKNFLVVKGIDNYPITPSFSSNLQVRYFFFFFVVVYLPLISNNLVFLFFFSLFFLLLIMYDGQLLLNSILLRRLYVHFCRHYCRTGSTSQQRKLLPFYLVVNGILTTF